MLLWYPLLSDRTFEGCICNICLFISVWQSCRSCLLMSRPARNCRKQWMSRTEHTEPQKNNACEHSLWSHPLQPVSFFVQCSMGPSETRGHGGQSRRIKRKIGAWFSHCGTQCAHAYWWGLTAWRFPTLSCFCMLSWNRNGWLALTEAMFMKPGISRPQWRTHANEAMMSWYHLTAVSSPHKSLPLRRGSYSSTTRWWKFRQGPNVIIWVVHSCAMLQNDMLQDFHSIVCMVCMANDSGSRSAEFLASMARIKQQMSCPQSGTSCWLNFNRTGLLRCS